MELTRQISPSLKRILDVQIFRDIRFWIVFFFIIRLYGITFPPLEIGHNWRQTDGLMIARNFYEIDSNLFFPRVDLAGEKTGIVGSEFPILNYLLYIAYSIFGYEDWYGRLIVLIFSSFGAFYFHKLIRRYFGESTAFNSTMLLLVSLWFSYSRKTMPDVFAASMCFFSLYNAVQYLESGKKLQLLVFFIFGALACLAKILAATILTVLIFPMLSSHILVQRKIVLSVFSVFILAGVYWWYFVWVPYLNTTYGFPQHFFMGMSFTEGVAQIREHWPLVLKRFYSTPFKYVGFIAFLTAILISIRKKCWLPLGIFAIPFIAFLVLLTKTGAFVIGDHYYLLTVIPCMAFITGYGLTLISKKIIVVIVLTIVGTESIAAQIYDFRLRQPFVALDGLEAIMDNISRRSDLIAINSETHSPTAMYFAHRRGWGATNAELSDSTFLNTIKTNGCKYVVVIKKLYGNLDLEYPAIYDSEYFKIYDLTSKGNTK